MKKEQSGIVHWPTILFSLFILSSAGAIQMGCSDQLIGLDESAIATQQANENIAVQVAKYTGETGSPDDDLIIATRPFEAGDSLPDITPPIVLPTDTGKGNGVDPDTVKSYRPRLEDEMNVVLSLCGRDTVNIGTAGGTINLSGLSGRGKLKFPVDALKKTEEITVLSVSSLTEELLLYEFTFGPHGTRFEKSIELELSDSLFISAYGKLPTEGVWMYLDEQAQTWSVLREVKVASDGNFHLPIEHFSTYRMVVTPAVALSQGGQN